MSCFTRPLLLAALAPLVTMLQQYAISNSSMHYFSPAVIQEKPYLLKAGQSLTLRYRVVIHPGRWSAEQLRDAAGVFASGA
jgi:hypothetical protein